jgi:hypothetical protein
LMGLAVIWAAHQEDGRYSSHFFLIPERPSCSDKSTKHKMLLQNKSSIEML